LTRRLWIGLALALVAAPAVFSYLSPGGNWGNLIFGYGFANEADPGSFYVISAHEFINDLGRPLFLGHPGVPLQAMLFAIQRAYFAVSGGHADFASFIARHLETVYTLSKIAMSIVSLASIAMVYWLSRSIGLQTCGARAAALAYATCFPFLYYVSRISVESQAVFFGFAALVCLFQAQDSHGPTRPRRSTLWAAASGAACALAMLSKMNQTAALIAIVPLGILISNGSDRLKLYWMAAFAAGVAAVLAPASVVMDWGYFFGTWATPGITPTTDAHAADTARMLAMKFWSVFADLRASVMKLSLRPQAGFNGMFNLIEFVFVVAGLAGVVTLARQRRASMRLLLVLAFVAWTLLLWWYRGTTVFLLAFHYLFFFMVLLSIGFGTLMESIADALASHSLQRWAPRVLPVALFVVHSSSVWAFVDTRLNDIQGFNRLSRGMFALEHQLPDGARAAILLADADFAGVTAYNGLDFSYVIGKTSNLQAALPMTGIVATRLTRERLPEALAPYEYVVDLIQGTEALRDGTVRLEPKTDWIAANRPLRRIGPLAIAHANCEQSCGVPDGAGPEFSASLAFDDNPGTAWYSYPSAEPQSQTVEIALSDAATISSVRLMNGPYDGLFARALELSVVRGDEVQLLARHDAIGPAKAGEWHELAFAPVTADRLRLVVTTSKHPSVPGYQFSIAEIQVRGYFGE
jgi:hypothetical protein